MAPATSGQLEGALQSASEDPKVIGNSAALAAGRPVVDGVLPIAPARRSRFARWLALPRLATGTFPGKVRVRYDRRRSMADLTLFRSTQRIKKWLASRMAGWQWNRGYGLQPRYQLIWAPRHRHPDLEPQPMEIPEPFADGLAPGAMARRANSPLRHRGRRRTKGYSTAAGLRNLSRLVMRRPATASPADSRREGHQSGGPKESWQDTEALGLDLPFGGEQEPESNWQSRPIDRSLRIIGENLSRGLLSPSTAENIAVGRFMGRPATIETHLYNSVSNRTFLSPTDADEQQEADENALPSSPGPPNPGNRTVRFHLGKSSTEGELHKRRHPGALPSSNRGLASQVSLKAISGARKLLTSKWESPSGSLQMNSPRGVNGAGIAGTFSSLPLIGPSETRHNGGAPQTEATLSSPPRKSPGTTTPGVSQQARSRELSSGAPRPAQANPRSTPVASKQRREFPSIAPTQPVGRVEGAESSAKAAGSRASVPVERHPAPQERHPATQAASGPGERTASPSPEKDPIAGRSSPAGPASILEAKTSSVSNPPGNLDPRMLRRLSQLEERRRNSNEVRTGSRARQPLKAETSLPAIGSEARMGDSGSTASATKYSVREAGTGPRAAADAATAPAMRDLPAASKSGNRASSPLDTPDAKRPAEQRPMAIRNPQTMSRGIGSRLGDMLRWKGPDLGEKASNITVLQSGISQTVSSIHQPEKWSAKDLDPSATGRESTPPLPQVASGRGFHFQLKSVPASDVEVPSDNSTDHPVLGDPGSQFGGQSGLNEYRTPDIQAIPQEPMAKSGGEGRQGSTPIRSAISMLAAKAGTLKKSDRTHKGSQTAPPARGTSGSFDHGRGSEALNDEHSPGKPGIVGAASRKPFVSFKRLDPLARRNSAGPVTAVSAADRGEKQGSFSGEVNNPLAEDNGPRHLGTSGEHNSVRPLVRGTRKIASVSAGMVLLSRHFLHRRGSHSPHETAPESPVEAFPEANFHPSIAKPPRHLAAGNGKVVASEIRKASKEAAPRVAAPEVRTAPEEGTPGVEPRQSFRPEILRGQSLARSRPGRIIKPSLNLHFTNAEETEKGSAPGAKSFVSSPALSGRMVISRSFLIISRIRGGLASSLTFRKNTPKPGESGTSAPQIAAAPLDSPGTPKGNSPSSLEPPVWSSPLSKGSAPANSPMPTPEQRKWVAQETAAISTPTRERERGREQAGSGLIRSDRAFIIRRAVSLASVARTLVLRKSTPDFEPAVKPPEEELLPRPRERVVTATAKAPFNSPVWEVPTWLQRQVSAARPGIQIKGRNSQGPSLFTLPKRKTRFQELFMVPRRSALIPRNTRTIRRLPIEPPAKGNFTMAGLPDSAKDAPAGEDLTMAGLLDSANQAPAREGLTMAGLLESVNQAPGREDLVLPASQTVRDASHRRGIVEGTGRISAASGLTLRRQAVAPEGRSERPPTVPEPATTVRSRPHTRTERGSTDPATDRPTGDVTDFKGWEIEFLASRVFTYLQRKLDIERERHGRAGFNPWL